MKLGETIARREGPPGFRTDPPDGAARSVKDSRASSPYSSAFTGCGFMLDEMAALVPVLSSPDADALLRKEVEGNEILALGKAKTRSRMITEFKRRYAAMPPSFWRWFLSLDRPGRTVALYYCLLRTYLVLKEVHLDVVLPRLRSANPVVERADIERFIAKIGETDAFVASWSDNTKERVATACLSMLREIGMLGRSNRLAAVSIPPSVARHFATRGEAWYLEALGMPFYEIKRLAQEGDAPR